MEWGPTTTKNYLFLSTFLSLPVYTFFLKFVDCIFAVHSTPFGPPSFPLIRPRDFWFLCKSAIKGDGIKARRLRRFGKLKYTPPASCGRRNPQQIVHCGCRNPWAAIHELNYIPCGLWLVDCGKLKSTPGCRNPRAAIHEECRQPWIAAAYICNDVPQLERFYTVLKKSLIFYLVYITTRNVIVY